MNPRKPTALHKLQGTYRPDRHGKSEPESPDATGRLPRWAELEGEAEKCYRRLAPMLTSMRVLTQADIAALVQLCRRYAEYMELRAQVTAEGATYVVESRNGHQRKTNPAAMVRDRAWADFQKGLTEFGLTPVSRSRITAPPEVEESEMAKLLGNG